MLCLEKPTLQPEICCNRRRSQPVLNCNTTAGICASYSATGISTSESLFFPNMNTELNSISVIALKWQMSQNMEGTITFFYCHFLLKHSSEVALHCRCLHICQHISELGSCYFELIFQPNANWLFLFRETTWRKKRFFLVILLVQHSFLAIEILVLSS